MEAWLRHFWVPMSGGKAHHQINVASVGGWPNDYRIPDLVLLTPDRFHIDKHEYYEGAPTVVVEIRSPEDETYDKFDFYARVHVPEIWVIERDSREPEIHTLGGSEYRKLEYSPDGQLQSPTTNISMWADKGKLAMQSGDDTTTIRFLP
jgi:Uma2 family endonuclease